MTIEDILNSVPRYLLTDLSYCDIKNAIIDVFKNSNAKMLLPISIDKKTYGHLNKKDNFQIADVDTFLSFTFVLGDSLCFLEVKRQKNSIIVIYEVSSHSLLDRIILVKSDNLAIVESKYYLKEEGIFKVYNTSIRYYDNNFKEVKIDPSNTLDEMFSDEFGIPLKSARKMREKFFLYANFLSYSAVEQKMRIRDAQLSSIDFLYIRSPWIVRDIDKFLHEEYDNERKIVLKKHFNKINNAGGKLKINRIAKIINWIQGNLNDNSEMVMADNLFTNFLPILLGEDASGFDTKGIIVEKMGEDYFLYQVHFTTDKISFVKSLITLEQAQELFLANPLNENVKGLKEFFGITRGR